jgi:hypothetical protein
MEDAAKLFIAVAAESPLKNTLESWREFAQLGIWPLAPGFSKGHWTGLPKSTPSYKELRRLPKNHLFLDALSALMLDLSHERAYASVDLSGPLPLAQIRLRQASGPFVVVSYTEGPTPPDKQLGDLKTVKRFSWRSMCDIAQLVAPPGGDAADDRAGRSRRGRRAG